jgi:LCP family protein required for cell wall assembly
MSHLDDTPSGGLAGWRRWTWLAGRGSLAVASLLVLSVSGYAWASYHALDSGLRKSSALAGEATSQHGDTNILIMGLDSRVDEAGNPLPPAIYDALHAGGANDGGENANVLMLLHVPGDGSRATSISIPRDDYVDLPGCPDGQCKGKIKQAYGLAYDAAGQRLADQAGTAKVQQQRDAGRKTEIDTVRQLLGGVPIDHFVEVTLVAFFQIAQVVQPITVCVNEDTQDSYSDAHFHQGVQQINASQAVSFVRQRRDNIHPALNFTDLDRERRQQAFIASLANQLKQAGTLADPAKLQGLLDVAKQNIAVDTQLNLMDFAGQATNLTGGNITFVTLPIDHFGKDPAGEDVNIVDVPAIQQLVHQLLGGTSPPTPASSSAGPSADSTTHQTTVDVVNANGRAGLAEQVEHTLVTHGYRQGSTSTATVHQTRSVIYYDPGQSTVATEVAQLLGGLPTESDGNVPTGHVRVVLGSGFSKPAALGSTDNATSPAAFIATGPTPPTTPTPGPEPAGGLNGINGGGIPCVK